MDCAMHPVLPTWGRRAQRQPLLQHTGTAGRACPSGLAGMMLQGGPCPMLCATKACQGSEHLIPAETGNWGHL